MTEGSVIIIGGAEDKVRDRVILSRFAALAGGRDATVAVISTASSLGLEAGDRYKQVLGELGVKKVRIIHAVTRAQANDDSVAVALRDATGIFMTGGNQLRLSSTIGGTRLADAVLERFRHGAVVAGTSAGASAMSSHMIAFGASGATPKHRMAQIAAGLGVLPGVIVDQHFQQRNRLGRLLSLIAQNPSLLGLGVDEDTAGVVGPDHVMEVIGRGSITVVDGARSETDAWEVHGHRPLMISGVVLHSLPAGYRFDLRKRERDRDADPPRRAGREGGLELGGRAGAVPVPVPSRPVEPHMSQPEAERPTGLGSAAVWHLGGSESRLRSGIASVQTLFGTRHVPARSGSCYGLLATHRRPGPRTRPPRTPPCRPRSARRTLTSRRPTQEGERDRDRGTEERQDPG